MNIKFYSKFIIFLLFLNLNADNKQSPFSKIEISSDKATVCKNQNNKNIFNFTYQENVLVKFADGSSAKADELEIKLNTGKNKNKNKNKNIVNEKLENLTIIEEITFNKHVLVQNENKTVTADIAQIYPKTKICKFSGNVQINQTKVNPKDLPISTKCDNATLDLVTEKIILSGNKDNPINTTISLEGYPELMNPIKIKK